MHYHLIQHYYRFLCRNKSFGALYLTARTNNRPFRQINNKIYTFHRKNSNNSSTNDGKLTFLPFWSEESLRFVVHAHAKLIYEHTAEATHTHTKREKNYTVQLSYRCNAYTFRSSDNCIYTEYSKITALPKCINSFSSLLNRLFNTWNKNIILENRYASKCAGLIFDNDGKSLERQIFLSNSSKRCQIQMKWRWS